MAGMKHYKSIQVRVRESTHHQIKHLAYDKGQTIAEFILQALANQKDPELTKLIRAEIKHRPKPGMPQTRRMYLKLFLKHLPPRLKARSVN
jgi:hypothetical protein